MIPIRTIASIFCLGISLSTAMGELVSFATFALPKDSDGIVHIRIGENETQAVQLNKNQFSPPIRVPSSRVEVYEHPLDPEDKPQKPFLLINLAEGSGPYKAFVWSAPDKDGEKMWHGRAYDCGRWPESCMVLVNFTNQTIGFRSTKIQHTIATGRTVLFNGKREKNGSPVKLFIMDPKNPKTGKLVFSSVWRVPENEQELLVIFPKDRRGSVMTRSFMTTKEPVETDED